MSKLPLIIAAAMAFPAPVLAQSVDPDAVRAFFAQSDHGDGAHLRARGLADVSTGDPAAARAHFAQGKAGDGARIFATETDGIVWSSHGPAVETTRTTQRRAMY